MTEKPDRHPFTGQPIGPPVDATPARAPEPVTLEGRYGRVERLRPDHDADLWSVVKGHDPIWTYMSTYGPFAELRRVLGMARRPREARRSLFLRRSSIRPAAPSASPR